MSFEQFVFYLFATILVISALGVVTVRNPIYAALCLILAFFTSAALWLLLQAEFLGVVLVLVYVGAVMVLFLFVIMMLDINLDPLREGFVKILPIGLPITVIIAAEIIFVLSSGAFNFGEVIKRPEDYSNTEEIGKVLYTDYVYAFEIAAVLLVVAIIAAIALAHRKRDNIKTQDIHQQVQVKRSDRVRLVKMPSEARQTPSPDGKHHSTQPPTQPRGN